MIYDIGPGKLHVRFSADGVHWSDPIATSGFGSRNGDTHNNAFWDDRIGKYVCFSRLYSGERLVSRFESDDFLNWHDSGVVLRSKPAEGKTLQTYCMTAFPYANAYLGYVMMYRAGGDRSVDCELAWSPDGVAWKRVLPGTPFIPRGPKGSYDSECIYAAAGPPVVAGNELLIFYGGSDYPHRGWKRHCLPCLARAPLDRFAGYAPTQKQEPAILNSFPLLVGKTPFQISADASQGELRVIVFDKGGSIPAESEPIRENVTNAPLRWRQGDWLSFGGQTVRLRFVLSEATLFAIRGITLAADRAEKE